MSDGIHLTHYHQMIVKWLKEHVNWLKLVDFYPETETALPVPCAFFSVQDWERSEDQRMNGQLTVTLSCELLAVLGIAEDKYQLDIRNAAMALAIAVEGERFGLPVEPAVFSSAEPDAFNPELDDYAVWSIRFTQEIDIGKDEFQYTGVTPSTVKVGYVPKVGLNDQDSYEQVTDERT
ncbi:hypothetical protein ACFSJQ_17720 [Vibrio olivae]|uniref:Phage tail protein n=1 Tax=Vibrio olivae TaxID=1243002 RepID=A0ABV5HR37_9VIBR